MTHRNNMKKLGMVTLFLLIGFVTVYAGDYWEHKKYHRFEHEMDPYLLTGTFYGKNVCIGCELNDKHGTVAECKKYGHEHGLKLVSVVDINGEEQKGMEGMLIHYLRNKKGRQFFESNHDEYVKIKGKLYIDARVLEVESYENAKHPKK